MPPKKNPVSTAAIVREIKAAQKKLEAMLDRAAPQQKRDIKLELKLLGKCKQIASDIFEN